MALLCALILASSIVQPASATYTKMRDFSVNYADGAYPLGQFALSSGVLYGFTEYGVNGAGSLIKVSAAGTVATLNNFTGGATSPYTPNSGPVISGTTLYGTSIYGGTNNIGVIFKSTLTGTISVLHSFTGGATDGAYGYSGVILGSDGNLYGTTYNGGTKNQGTVYQYNLSTNVFTILHSFDSTVDAYLPFTGLCEGPDGYLYGTVYYATGFNGGIYRVKKDGTSYSFIHGFGGADPAGYYPRCDLVKASNGKLYGTCTNGGANGIGTIIAVDPAGNAGAGSVSLVWTFDGYTGSTPGNDYANSMQYRLAIGAGTAIYGIARYGGTYGYGTIFKLDTSTGLVTLVVGHTQQTGNTTSGPLTLNGTTLYGGGYYAGTTASSGAGGAPNGVGSFFSCTTTGTLKLLHSFFIRDLRNPQDSPTVQIGGFLYGTALYGGQEDQGAIYKISATGPSYTYTLLHSFNSNLQEGHYPYQGLFKAADGALYGSTYSGGIYGYGTIYKISTAGVFTILHHFRGNLEGYDCFRKFTQGAGTDKNLYGICNLGGTNNVGCIFKIDTAGKNYQVIHYFHASDGNYPHSELTVEKDGSGNTKYIYGTTYSGGAHNYGVLFRVTPKGDSYTDLHDFDAPTGAYGSYYGGPIPEVSGVLYGTTYQGGTSSNGVFYKYDTTTSTYTVLHNFNNGAGEGYYPCGGLTMDGSGNFYGVCIYGGTSGYGTVWKYNPGTNTFTLLHNFLGQASDEGANPYGGVMYDSVSGLLYGTTTNGGANNYGQIFSQTTVP